jgi:hypothetical protein
VKNVSVESLLVSVLGRVNSIARVEARNINLGAAGKNERERDFLSDVGSSAVQPCFLLSFYPRAEAKAALRSVCVCVFLCGA